ncbi:MAG: RNA polymerase sigma factor [Bdellovibrionota bacterium]
MYKLSEQEKRFESYRRGHGKISDITTAEREFLFDYLIRMTGVYNRAADTTDDVISKILDEGTDWSSLIELRTAIFREARYECKDIWNATTEKLVNQAIENESKYEDNPKVTENEIKKRKDLDRFVARLSPHRREALLLNCRHGFSIEESSQVMGVDLSVIATEVAAGLKNLKMEAFALSENPRNIMRNLEPHCLPENATVYITDLQELMGNIDKGIPGRLWRLVRIFVLLVIFAGLGYLYLFEKSSALSFIFSIWDWLTHLLS